MMEKKNQVSPLVSVVMPVYNAQAYLAEAIESVQTQTVSDWELLVIDDGSSDESVQIARSFAQQDDRIRLMENEENMGVACTRNRGFAMCTGRYVALLDSDDYWKPQMLEKMIARAEQTGADILYCSYEIVDEQGRKLCNDFLVPEQTDFQQSIVRSVITCSSVLLAGDLARQIRFPTDVYHEDIALWFRLLKEGTVARGVPEVLSAYRQRADSRSARKVVSAFRRWPIYRRHLGLSVWQSLWALARYGYYGVLKFRQI